MTCGGENEKRAKEHDTDRRTNLWKEGGGSSGRNGSLVTDESEGGGPSEGWERGRFLTRCGTHTGGVRRWAGVGEEDTGNRHTARGEDLTFERLPVLTRSVSRRSSRGSRPTPGVVHELLAHTSPPTRS